MKVQYRSTINKLITRYLISFGLLAILIIGGMLWSEYQLAKQENDSRVVNISGRQRMLSQKISKVVAKLTTRPDAETSARLAVELEDALTLWEHSQSALRFGDASIGIVGNNSPTINRMYADLNPIYERILNSGRVIITLVQSGRAESEEFSHATSEIFLSESSFLASMDNIVFAHDSEASVRVIKSRIIVLSINILLLLFLVFSWFFLIRLALQKAQATDKAKTEFVSLASHQLRTPLSTVNWYTEMLLAGDVGKLTPEQKKYLEEIYMGNQRMVELINALLNVSRLELGTFVIEPEPTNVIKLTQSVVDEQKPQIDEKKIKLSTLFEKNIPTIQADPKLLHMVFQNLLSNAVKYTPEGGSIKLSMSNVKGQLLIVIEDTGYGIPKNQQDKIFTKLFRADNIMRKDTEGTGLGLYIVKSIIKYSGGKIWFESPASTKVSAGKEENPGTTFYITLPLEGMKKKGGTKALA